MLHYPGIEALGTKLPDVMTKGTFVYKVSLSYSVVHDGVLLPYCTTQSQAALLSR